MTTTRLVCLEVLATLALTFIATAAMVLTDLLLRRFQREKRASSERAFCLSGSGGDVTSKASLFELQRASLEISFGREVNLSASRLCAISVLRPKDRIVLFALLFDWFVRRKVRNTSHLKCVSSNLKFPRVRRRTPQRRFSKKKRPRLDFRPFPLFPHL